jgi:hypothetical protein
MATLATVAEYITRARVLLMDQTSPYRYSDAEITAALDLGISESARIRPDLWMVALRTAIPTYSGLSTGTAVVMPVNYRTALLYYIVGHCQIRDDEETTDERAAALLNKFVSQLTTQQA